MDDVQETAGKGVDGIKNGLTHKLGPLPVWGWLLVVGVVGGAGFLIFRSMSGGGGTAQPGSVLPGLPDAGAGGGGGGAAPPPTSTVPAVTGLLTNTDWLTQAAAKVAQSLNIPESEAALYLREYVNGNAPGGSNQAYSLFQKVIDAATQAVGAPPQPITNGAANPYTSISGWVNDLLSFLPAGTSTQSRNEIVDLVNGTRTTLSQDASQAYEQALSIVGIGPQAFTYNVLGPAPKIDLSIIQQWQQTVFNSPAFKAGGSGAQQFWQQSLLNLMPNLQGAFTSEADRQAFFNDLWSQFTTNPAYKNNPQAVADYINKEIQTYYSRQL